MANSLEEQQEMFVTETLYVRKKIIALNFLWEEGRKPENEVTTEIFDNLFATIYRLLWETLVIDISWVYHKHSKRGIYWYLKSMKKAGSSPSILKNIDVQISKIEALENKIEQIRKYRDKWIGHKDPETFENPETFWSNELPKIQDLKILVETVYEITQSHFPVDIQSTNLGVQTPFRLIKTLIKETPEVLKVMQDYNFIKRK